MTRKVKEAKENEEETKAAFASSNHQKKEPIRLPIGLKAYMISFVARVAPQRVW
jgi:hypothetical protein